MRILYIVTAFPRHSKDVITPWLSETIARLRARGVEVEVLAPSYRGLEDQVVDGVVVHRFRYAPAPLEALTHDQTTPDRIREQPLWLALVPGYFLAGTVAAVRLARTGRFDVIHAFWPLPHGVFGLFARAAAGTPLVSTFFGVELTWLRRQVPFFTPLLRSIINRSDIVTAISGYTAAEVRRIAPSADVRTIPFGAAVEPLSDSEPGSAAARDADDRFQVLFVGRLVQRKGVDVLIRAISVLDAVTDAKLVVVGDGPMKEMLEQLSADLALSERVEFRGFVDAGSLRRAFADADVTVLPAVKDDKGDVEGLGVVLIEALMHGCPVIASDSGGIGDIVQHEETGLLVPPGDVVALAAALTRLQRDPTLAQRLADAGRKQATERFGWDTVISELAGVYDELSHAESLPRPRRGPL